MKIALPFFFSANCSSTFMEGSLISKCLVIEILLFSTIIIECKRHGRFFIVLIHFTIYYNCAVMLMALARKINCFSFRSILIFLHDLFIITNLFRVFLLIQFLIHNKITKIPLNKKN